MNFIKMKEDVLKFIKNVEEKYN